MTVRPPKPRLRALAAVIAGLAASALAAPRPQAQAGPAFEIVRYDIDARVDPPAHSLSARATLTVRSRMDGARTLRVFLHREFAVRGAAADGAPLAHRLPGPAAGSPMFSPTAIPVDIDFPAPVSAGATRDVSLVYDGPVSGPVNDVNMISASLVELAGYCGWFPMPESNGDFSYALRISLPEDFVAVSDGDLVSSATDDGRTERVFRRERPGFDIPLVAAPRLKSRSREMAGISAEVYYRDLPDDVADSVLKDMLTGADFLARRLGPPSGRGRIACVYSPRRGWGYSRQPLMVIPERAVLGPAAGPAARAERYHGNLHEIAHFWWNLGDASTSDDWLNEAPAEFCAVRGLEDAYGPEAAGRVLARYVEDVRSLGDVPPILKTRRDEGPAYVLFYEKGACLFEMLAAKFGADRVFAALKAFHAGHDAARGRASTPDLVAAFARELGPEVRPVFDELLATSTLPAVRVEWTAAKGAVSGAVFLENTAIARLPVELAFGRAGGAEADVRLFVVSPGRNPFRFDLPFEAASVRVDPGGRLLLAAASSEVEDRSRTRALMPLLHGMNMDLFPEIVPAENLAKADAVLTEWESRSPGCAALAFEKGWVRLVRGDAAGAAAVLEPILPRSAELPGDMVRVLLFRALGMSLDRLGRRDEALGLYRRALDTADAAGFPRTQVLPAFRDFLERPYRGEPSLYGTAFAGDLAAVRDCLARDPAAARAADPATGRSSLSWALRGRDVPEVVEALLAAGADPEDRGADGVTALHRAASSGRAATARLLIKAGANLAARDEFGFTPLSMARAGGNAEMIKLLLDSGARE